MQMTVPRPREQALEQIMAYILENKLSADDKLPPEREMCQMWGVNRCTLRSAIAALTEQGIVYAVQGSRTRIAHRFRRILQDLQGFSEYAADCGLRPETRLLSMSQVECDKQLSRRLHMVLGENAYRISRLRILNGQPTLIETAYIPAALAPGLEEHDLVTGSLFSVLRDGYGLDLDHGEEKASITTAAEEEAVHLGIAAGDPVFWIVSITQTPEGVPVEYCRTVARADKVELEELYIPYSVVPSLEEVDIKLFSIYDIYQWNGIVLGEGHQTLRITRLPPMLAKHMDMPPEQAVMEFSCTTRDQGGRVVEFSRSYVRNDKAEFVVHFRHSNP